MTPPPEPSATSPEGRDGGEAERLLRRLRALLQVFGQITFDLDFREDRIDWTGAERLGYDPRTFGHSLSAWLDLIHPEDRAHMIGELANARSESSPLFCELRYRHADGQYRWFQARGLIQGGEDGTPTNLIGVLEDISGRRAQALVEAERDFLAKTNDELKEFAYVASHDLQEPLRTITAFVELLNEDHRSALDAEGREYLDFIGEAAARLQRLINDLLTYSRMSSGSEEITRLNLRRIVNDALENLYAALEESRARVEVDPLPEIVGQASRLVLLFQNLIGNALKFRRAGVEPMVRIRAREAANHWEVSVEDNGIGIPAEQHERIFRLFHRLHASSQYEGTGMGLAICTRIVERHGGRLWVKSEPGEGTSFHFTLAKAWLPPED
jgi:signal transduction histidine kinase